MGASVPWVEISLSGLGGAILATALGSVFQFWIERLRLKGDTMMAVVAWADDVYERIVALLDVKVAIYSCEEPLLTLEDYQESSRELSRKLLHSDMPVRVALVYGEKEEVELVNEFRQELQQMSSALYGARREAFPGFGDDFRRRFAEVVDPMRQKLEKKLLQRSRLPRWLLGIGL